ncbi:hypothetical protein EJ03DRAFT_178380 [Teratosphaeria nubilosa]|uniref:Secreted protein n=1 Tax=Teratosphaeria nubilosa TaxID=161662 RepID=A0A6G1L106_9PEZI|nr:hypothetical protein EJ03DRAFT_178380 [Teratosphaeria nubilosa]
MVGFLWLGCKTGLVLLVHVRQCRSLTHRCQAACAFEVRFSRNTASRPGYRNTGDMPAWTSISQWLQHVVVSEHGSDRAWVWTLTDNFEFFEKRRPSINTPPYNQKPYHCRQTPNNPAKVHEPRGCTVRLAKSQGSLLRVAGSKRLASYIGRAPACCL